MSTKKLAKKDSIKTIRINSSTKEKLDQFLKSLNSNQDSGKVTTDKLISFFIENTTPENIKELQSGSITWAHEDKRLRRIWEKKKGITSEEKWKEMLYLGQLKEFISEHSRLQV
jgi:hypothetical protein